MTVEQRCGTCRHWSLPKRGDRYGGCKWNGDIPVCFILIRESTQGINGADCPTWEATDE